MCELINHGVQVPLWGVIAICVLIVVLVLLDGWRAQQWQHLALLASRIGVPRPSATAPLDTDPESFSTTPDRRHTTRSTTA